MTDSHLNEASNSMTDKMRNNKRGYLSKFVAAFTLLVIGLNSLAQQQNADIIIRNGKIIDGTGNSWYYGDVVIRDGKIIHTGRSSEHYRGRVIDAKGMIVAPGFIDVHTHIEGNELATPTADNFIKDGVTTVITGNCGSSRPDIGAYFRFIDSLKLSVNVATLIGHNTVRRAVLGTANRQPSAEEVEKMQDLVRQAMKDGAVGLSSGLIYIPGTYSKTDELIALARAAALSKGIYATHMRSESDSVHVAIMEALRIGKEAGLPVQISHFKVGGQQNWKRSVETLELIRQARQQGIEVTIDQYPYTASSTNMGTMIPEEILSDGQDSIRARLSRPEVQEYVVKKMLEGLKRRKLKHFSYAVVANHRADTTLNGKSIEEINLLKGRKHRADAEARTVIEMMLAGGAQMVFHSMSEWDVTNIMKYPYNMFASDAGIREFGEGVPHPRGYGTNARVLSRYVRDQKVISLEEAIRRMTSLPAQSFQIRDRGILKEGMAADIVIFDAAKVQDLSTFDKPHAYSTGFVYVLVNGELVVENENHTGKRSGISIYGPARQPIASLAAE